MCISLSHIILSELKIQTYLIKFEHRRPLPRSFWPCSRQSLGLEQFGSWLGLEPPEGTPLEPQPLEFGLGSQNIRQKTISNLTLHKALVELVVLGVDDVKR